MGETVLCLRSVGVCERGRTIFSDLKHIVSLDFLAKLFLSPRVISHHTLARAFLFCLIIDEMQ